MTEAVKTDALPTSTKTGKAKATGAGGEPTPKTKRVAKKRVFYPGLLDEKGEPTKKLTEWPADYKPAEHKGISRKAFVNEAPFLRHQAGVLQERVNKMLQEANTCEKLGNAADRAKAKKLMAMRETMRKLEKELADQGIDVNDLKSAEPEAAATTEGAKVPA